MSRRFATDGPPRIVFGEGSEDQVPDELARLGAERVLLVCAAGRREGADRLAAGLGARAVGVFAEAQPHVPNATALAVNHVVAATGADWVVAHGGGSAIGAAKIGALPPNGGPLVSVGAVPTTYAGSEMTSIWGRTGPAGKVTGRDERVRPRLVVYDPRLVLALRPRVAAASLMNALAHVVEAMYPPAPAGDAGLQSLLVALGQLRDRGELDADGASDAMYGAHLAGVALGSTAMGLHHQLCHALGGTYSLPHAETHAVVLPYVVAFNGAVLPPGLAGHLWELVGALGLPASLGALGLRPADLDAVIVQVLARPYPNPVPVTEDGLRALLLRALAGERP